MLKIKRGQKGFTLIELLIVIAILGILVAIAIPAISGMTLTAKVGAANLELASVQTAAIAYSADNDGNYPPDGGQGLADSELEGYLSNTVKLAGGYTINSNGVVSPTTVVDGVVEYDNTDIGWDGLKFVKPS